eukprot:TRINITY_DN3137_c0_g1_i1.p1 TRINITY_DN3137_c0_g1~~TRINITY_DN3137_c0_g1_i1.p1  ORF type:complete len:125 (+),score=1.58 TRINITY_DN3137_c0_g1_i1:195-569(+)
MPASKAQGLLLPASFHEQVPCKSKVSFHLIFSQFKNRTTRFERPLLPPTMTPTPTNHLQHTENQTHSHIPQRPIPSQITIRDFPPFYPSSSPWRFFSTCTFGGKNIHTSTVFIITDTTTAKTQT